MQHIPDSLIEKLQKLKNLATGAKEVGSDKEAETAAAMFQALLLKYNLDEAALPGSSLNKKAQMLHAEFDTKQHFAWRASDWVYKLLKQVAYYSMCEVVIMEKEGIISVLGEKQNVELAMYFTEQLVAKIQIEFQIAWMNYKGYENSKIFRRGFLTGAVDAIALKLRLQERAMKAESGNTGMEVMVLSKRELAKRFTKDKFGGSLSTSKARRPDLRGEDGKEAGTKAGGKMELNKGLGSTSGGTKRIEG